MIIENISELKKILGNLDVISSEQDTKFIVLHTTIAEWRHALSSNLKDAGDGWIHVALHIQHDDPRLDTILFVCHASEINEWFWEALNDFIYNIKGNELLITALGRKWEKNNKAYPLLFMFSTRLDANYTTLCYIAMAPAYRQNGFMKRISLNLVENIMREFGEDHMLMSFTMHKATYLLFNPTDKTFKHFREADLQDLSCANLLRAHNVLIEKPVLTDTAKKGWMSQALLKPPVADGANMSRLPVELPGIQNNRSDNDDDAWALK